MGYKGLIIDDDVEIRRIACSVMDSLGHEHVEAGSQESARKRVEGADYILLDLEIPEKESRGFPRIQNGLNLLEELVKAKRTAHIPVIVMTAHGKGDPSLAVEVLTTGAANWINKPFPPMGRTLDNVIKETLAKRSEQATSSPSESNRQLAPVKQFAGGAISYLQDCVTVCDVRVASSTSIMGRILYHLREKNSHGRYRSFSCEELADLADCAGGQNTISSTISEFRRKTPKLLLEHAGQVCLEEDIIESVNGVRFKDWITVVDGAAPAAQAQPSAPPLARKATAESRQEWILGQLNRGTRLRVADIAKGCECSSRTALRDMEELKAQGRVKFIGEPKTGYYGLSE